MNKIRKFLENIQYFWLLIVVENILLNNIYNIAPKWIEGD